MTRLLRNPVTFGVLGSLASLISLPLAVYFYIESRATRELRLYPNPARAVVAKSGQTSRLSIALDGRPIDGDVSAVQIAFWNAGRASIRPENMLRHLRISTSPATPIIDVVVRKKSRAVVHVSIVPDELATGAFTVRWNILERNDGAILQVVYLGDVGVPITASATVEGQGELKGPQVSTAPSPEERQVNAPTFSRVLGWFYVILGVLVGFYMAWRLKHYQLVPDSPRWAYLWRYPVHVGPPVFLFTTGLWLLVRSISPGPPFGF